MRKLSPEYYLSKEVDENWHELQGMGFLREESRDPILAEFQTLISSTQQGMIYVVSEEILVEFENKTYPTVDTNFYVKGDIPPLFFAQPCKNPLKDRPKIQKEFPDALITEKGYARVFVAYRYPAHLPEGFLYSTFGLAKEIILQWQKMPPQKVLSSFEVSISRKSRIGSVADSAVVSNIEELINLVREGIDILSFYLYFVVHANNKQELQQKSVDLQHTLKSYGIEIECPRFFQSRLYNFEVRFSFSGFNLFSIKKTIADARSMRALFPFIKENFVDDGGVFLGFSGTGDPIVFNPYKRHNYLMLILGETGSGKSMSSKIYLRRLHEKRSIPIYGIDPESEYAPLANYFGSTSVQLKENAPLGLDPIRMNLDRVMVAEILSEVYSIPPQLRPRLRKELFSTTSENMFDFIEKSDKDMKKYLEPILSPPDYYIFSGSPPNTSKPIIFGLRGLRSDHLKILTTSLISVYLGQEMRQSVVFVDEGWLFIRTPRIMHVFENIARRGRKHGLHFIFITQRVEDVASTPEGRTLLEQAATALLLRQEKEGVDAIKNIYKLSDGEMQSLVNASPGEGLLKAENMKISIRVVATSEELRTFSTTPLIAEG
ncbi:MAG: DUF87 domain-containing protein [Archaeoglobaceae archaeon]|nr:DUF87 domain-containing protein [Archaeoglobaceae archaeon]MDW7990299.1 DUF87 domain-containing protein [Archaeoglobaceae archaeon]